jgi:23S rRNA (uracil1939-C5)-methyltransferase
MKSMDESIIGNTVEFEVGNAVYGGNFVGRTAVGKTVFVPYVLPGERVQVRITEDKKNFARGSLQKVIKPALERINARCPHFGVCGGCHYQHMPYSRQLELKRTIVLDQFMRIGKFASPAVHDVIPSPDEWNYRNTVQFHVSENGKLGFQKAASADTLEIAECHLPENVIMELWQHLDFDAQAGIERVSMRADADGEVLLGLESTDEEPPDFSLDFPLSVVLLGKEQDLTLSGEPSSRFIVRGQEFVVSARSFFQINLKQAEAMVEHVLRLVNWSKSQTVFDLYSGVGLFSRFIAPLVKEMIGIELSESACNDFATNLDPFENTSLYMGPVEQILPQLKVKPDAVIADPPRAGLEPRVIDALIKSGAKEIVYVSCDPTTLARDCRTLVEGGYELADIQPFDLFPQTYHIETVCLLKRKNC